MKIFISSLHGFCTMLWTLSIRRFHSFQTLNGLISVLFCLLVAEFDDGGPVVWRIYMVVFGFMFLFGFLVDVGFFRKIQTMTYLVKNYSREEIYQNLKNYMKEEYIGDRMKQYENELKLELANLETEEDEALGFFERKNLREKHSIWQEMKKFKKELLHTFFIATLVALSFPDDFFSYAIYIGTKGSKDQSIVSHYTKLNSFGSLFQSLAGFLWAIFDLGKNRKFSQISLQFFSAFLWALCGIGYIFGNKDLSFWSALAGQFCFVIISGIWLYSNDVLPERYFPILQIWLRIMTSLRIFLFPLYMKIESTGDYMVGMKLFGVSFLALVGALGMKIWMLETRMMDRTEVFKQLRKG